MKTISITCSILFLILGINSCSNSKTLQSSDLQNIIFQATLNSASATPSNTSKATGKALFTYNPNTFILTGTITFQGMTPTDAHIHQGAVGVSGITVFRLASGTITSPLSYTSPVLTASQQADLLANLYYINLHSIAYPDGEIRGKLVH